MDDLADDVDMKELEERLYGNIHHGVASENIGIVPQYQGDPVRLVTDKAVVNDAHRVNQNLKRYWSSMNSRGGKRNTTYPSIANKEEQPPVTFENIKVKPFVPYTSILSGIGPIASSISTTSDSNDNPQNIDKAIHKIDTPMPCKKVLNPTNPAHKSKVDRLTRYQKKKIKAEKSRLHANAPKIISTIVLESSSEEDTDDVVVIAVPPPPLVCIESSDESSKEEFTQPKDMLHSASKNTKKTINSPRCLSPSNSSILSDDFIGQHDRSRTFDSYGETIADDDELVCNTNPTVNTVLQESRTPTQNVRTFSASSDSTNITASAKSMLSTKNINDNDSIESDNFVKPAQNDTQKTSSEFETHSECSNSSDLHTNLKVIKQQLVCNKKNLAISKTVEVNDSIYATKGQSNKQHKENDDDSSSSQKSNKLLKRRKSLNNKSSEDTSSSDENIDEPRKSKSAYNSDSSSKSKKKIRKRRKKFDSENYSDEDFVHILTDLVHALSGNEEEDGDVSEVNWVIDTASDAPEQESDDKTEEKTKKPEDDILELKLLPPSTISLPQIEAKTATKPPIVIDDISDLESSNSQQNKNSPSTKKRPENNFEENNDPEICWNDELKRFYNHSWNCEDFNISTVMCNMPRNQKHWPIHIKDKFPDPVRKRVLCHNCNDYGHNKFACKQKMKPIVCYICGEQGHREPRCPNTICFKCGHKTAAFIRECRNCINEKHIVCHLCGCRGHSIRYCPDKWRRYHSTTEDHRRLNTHVVPNVNAKHCSICSRSGHVAHTCNNALRIFGSLPNTTHVKNYAPVYHIQLSRKKEVNDYNYNTFSNLVDYELRFDETIMRDENNFYNRFSKAVGLLRKRKRIEARKRKVQRKIVSAPAAITAGGTESTSKSIFVTIQNTPPKETQDKEPHKITEEPQPQPSSSKAFTCINENSNYDFSEFYEHEEPSMPLKNDKFDAELPEFIPLTSVETPKTQNVIENKDEENAKIFLSKMHAKILLGHSGSQYLKESSIKYNLKLSISFEMVGNVLLAQGSADDQDYFHVELIKFLTASEKAEQKMVNNVPKRPAKVVDFIQRHLEMLEKKFVPAKTLYKRLCNLQHEHQHKSCEKVRKCLNIVLFGQHGLRDGKMHLDSLRANLISIESCKDEVISSPLRDEINQHIQYIFTSFDHENYGDLISYLKNKLNAPTITFTVEPSLDANTEATCEASGSNVAESQIEDDFILNVSTASNNSVGITSEKRGNKKWMSKTNALLTECRAYVSQLTDAQAIAKFERLCAAANRGRYHYRYYVGLLRIHSMLKKIRAIPSKNGGVGDLCNDIN